LKIGAAAAVYPNSTIIVSPAISFLAACITELLVETNAAASIGWAIVTIHIVRRTGNRLNSGTTVVVALAAVSIVIIAISAISPVVIVTITANYFEIRPATVIHPHTVSITAPAVALLATGVTALFDHVDVGVTCIYGAVATMAILGGTIECLLS
jgi:hypothetical protein